ncbi:MAG: M23 family metallopeptidase, partial [Muribaculaceae bacterium]|nr:M23 family metallopeptidase [Muribaculaceae bacterium]
TIVGTFGRHSHEEYSKVEIQNNGLDFEAEAGANACSVFPGTVSMVIVMEGYRNVVLIRHGEYLTVYAGLETLNVRKGQQVEAGTVLGRMVTEQSDSSKSRLHFEIRHEKQKLNPAEWLR